eukprot:TRINITY_DN6184_c0_g1_i1.p1 TRINITY_DN6184_c0_g1~~TRINITY_DN6184_c0_g1_i1.p1  ORF type:complete len:271 (-),score=51.69 TRINITY_DN6184_c0_g1_i1:104-916(-)
MSLPQLRRYEADDLTNVRLMDTVEIYQGERKTAHKRKVISTTMFGLQIGIGLFEIILAGLWRHWFGIFLGVFVVLFALLALYVTTTPVYYSDRVSRLKKVCMAADFAIVFFAFILIIIHLIGKGPDPIDGFPSACKRLTNCARIAPTNANLNSTIWPDPSKPPIFTSNDNATAAVMGVFENWLDVQTGSPVIIYKGPNANDTNNLLYHVRFVTFVFGFPDDLFVLLNPVNTENVAIWIQGAAREGIKDFNVNQARVESLVSYVVSFNLTS